jgi:L-lactate dehydrogenase complex protein LldE
VAARTYELSEFLVDVLRVSRGSIGAQFNGKITYQPACQQLRMLRSDDQARALLAGVEGAELHPLADAESCCGFGGLFSVQLPQIAGAMAERKARAIDASKADLVVTGETGCLMHMAGALSGRGSPCRAVHLAELLAGISPGSAIP